MSDKYKMYIGGEWVDAKGGQTFADYNPATGELWAQIAGADRADAKAAVKAAHDARTAWADTLSAGFILSLSKGYELLTQRSLALAFGSRSTTVLVT